MNKIDTSEIDNGLSKFQTKFMAGLEMYCDTAAAQLEDKAKRERPWTDRTGDARKRLKGSHIVNNSSARIVLAHGVDYGVWLELAHEKQYAIVEPTVRLKSNEILTGLENFISNLEV